MPYRAVQIRMRPRIASKRRLLFYTRDGRNREATGQSPRFQVDDDYDRLRRDRRQRTWLREIRAR